MAPLFLFFFTALLLCCVQTYALRENKEQASKEAKNAEAAAKKQIESPKGKGSSLCASPAAQHRTVYNSPFPI